MSNIIPIKTINSPAIASAFGYQESDLTEGASMGFPCLTYRGKVWRVVHKGNETPLVTPDGDPIPSVRLVLLKANPNLSKIYYEKSYSEGDTESPDCFSSDGSAPDSSVKAPQSKKCDTCPKAQWGSRMSEDGKELKACQDSRRLVVVPSNDIANEALGGPMLLRVPAASLGNLVAYDDMLKKANAAYFGVATKISFDMDAAYPKLQFEYDGPSTENIDAAMGQLILDLREGEASNRILEISKHEHKATSGEAAPAAPAIKPAIAAPPVVEVAEAPPAPVAAAPVTAPVVEEPSPSAAPVGEVVSPEVSDVDALVNGLLNG